MDEQPKSRGKIYVSCFAICIIVAGLFAMFGIALQTGKSQVDGLVSCDDAIFRTRENLERNLQLQYAATPCDSASELPEEIAQLQNLADEMVCQIEMLRTDLICFTEGKGSLSKETVYENGRARVPHISTSEFDNSTEFDQPTYYLISQNDGPSRAAQLKEAIGKFKAEVLALVPAERRAAAKTELEFLNTNDRMKDGKKITWEEFYFDRAILISAITTLDSFSCDIRNAESIILRNLTQ